MQEVCSAGTVTLEIWGERGEDIMKKPPPLCDSDSSSWYPPTQFYFNTPGIDTGAIVIWLFINFRLQRSVARLGAMRLKKGG